MKKCSVFFMSLTVMAFLLSFQLFAQAPDTLDVPDRIDGVALGAINKFIHGDTTATGERNNPNRVYRLSREKIYFVNDAIRNHDFHLTMIAAKPADPANPSRPPVVMSGILEDGSLFPIFHWAGGDLTIKGIYYYSFRPDAIGNQWGNGWDSQVLNYGDSTTTIVDNCIFEGACAAITSKAYWQDYIITNSLCRNGINEATWYAGHFFLTDGLPLDTLIMVNNTSFNNGGFTCFSWGERYMLFEHNTVFTTHVNPFWAGGGTNRDIKNNIIFAPFTKGAKVIKKDGEIVYDERGWSEYDGEVYSVTSVDTMQGALLDTLMGITEAERYINFQNNAYCWPKAVTDYWAAHADSVYPITWQNARSAAMFADNATWPGLHCTGNIEADPGFNQDMMDLVQKQVNFVEMFTTNTMAVYRHYYPSDNPMDKFFPPAWPLTEDLTYTNTALMTAGTDGFPLGDLNWYPDKKAQWLTAVESQDVDEMAPRDFDLCQNYPNPFNPTTTIAFSLKKGGHVSLAVYNLLGQKVKTLLDEKMIAGIHHATWDGTDEVGKHMASGIYYYRVETESHKAMKKMLLMK